jgi:arylformamidase
MREMEIIDITVPIRSSMVVFEGDPPVRLVQHASMARGDLCDVSRLEFGVHTGTHVDAPGHFIQGAPGVEALPLDALLGPAWVVDATGRERDLDEVALDSLDLPADAQRILFKTDNSLLWERAAFSSDYIGLTAGAAARLVERGVRLVGADYLSIAPSDDPAPTHRELLSAGVVILEGLDLRGVEAGRYELRCLPLRLDCTDGAPARALLVR